MGQGGAMPSRCGAFEFVFAPALSLAGPEEGFAADLVAADPVEGFLLDIRVEFIRDKEVLRRFTISVTAGYDGVVIEDGLWQLATMGETPGRGQGGRVVFQVFDGTTAFEQEGA